MTELGRDAYINGDMSVSNRMVEMFHSGTEEGHKNSLTEQMLVGGGRIRLLICTGAFGMGVDVPDINAVVLWGIPQTTLSLWQTIGRAGRDGRRALAMCYAYKRSISAKTFIKPDEPLVECVRFSVLSIFIGETSLPEKVLCTTCTDSGVKCKCDYCCCCIFCFALCKCPHKYQPDELLKSFM